jgi:hypothetical protein
MMTQAFSDRWEQQIPGLPLAVYREIVAHLQQVDDVLVGLTSQSAAQFDYSQSQIGSLWVQYTANTDATARARVQQILAYYGDRFGPWQPLALS